ncbi:MAG TPA: hypothetical protein VIL65_11150 [Beijerinckiaceae bacterium]
MPRANRNLPEDQSPAQGEIEGNNAASSGHRDDSVPVRASSRSARAETRRAATKATGTMSISKKTDPETRVAGFKEGVPASGNVQRSVGGKPAKKGLEQGSEKTGGSDRQADADAPTRITLSNAEISEGLTTTARKSPAPRSAQTSSGSETGTSHDYDSRAKKTGGARQRAPAPGNVVTVSKRQAVQGVQAKPGGRKTSSEGGTKPAKKSARGGHSTGASKSKGADQGVAE